MNSNELHQLWKEEESIAHIHGWDFSHIHGRYAVEEDLPWDYTSVIREYLTDDMKLLDYDTGGGEFLLSLGHPHINTAATEGYPPNVELCRKTFEPLGIDFRPCADPAAIPFPDTSMDMMINRHGKVNPIEVKRLLKENGIFITQQVGEMNDRDLVLQVLPDTPVPFPGWNLSAVRQSFEAAGMKILRAEETFQPIRFFDVGAFVWFARIIEWEFPGFSVDACFDRLLELQKVIDSKGVFEGTIHRFLLVAQK